MQKQQHLKCAGVLGACFGDTECTQSLDKHLSSCVPEAVLGTGGRDKADAVHLPKVYAISFLFTSVSPSLKCLTCLAELH